MQSEYLYPEIADRLTPGAWEEMGRHTLYEQAHEKVKQMLTDYYPTYIDAAADKRIRDKFPIKLSPKTCDLVTGAGNSLSTFRWELRMSQDNDQDDIVLSELADGRTDRTDVR